MKKFFVAAVMLVATVSSFANNEVNGANNFMENAPELTATASEAASPEMNAETEIEGDELYSQLAEMAIVAKYAVTNYHSTTDPYQRKEYIHDVKMLDKGLKKHDCKMLRLALNKIGHTDRQAMTKAMNDYKSGIISITK